MRRTVGVVLLAISVIDSLLWLSGWLHPIALRWRAQGGLERSLVIVLSSLTFKAVVLFAGVILAFWPQRE